MSYGNFQWLMVETQTGRGRCLWIPLGRDFRSVLRQQIFLAPMFIVLADSSTRLMSFIPEFKKTKFDSKKINKSISKGKYSKGKQ